MTTSAPDQPVGLRERKKAKTRAAIQDHALRLFIEQGYAATTVEQIAAAAEVSQSTFFRYFPTKEDTVLYDRLDPVLIESFLRQPDATSPISAVRAAAREVFEQLGAEESEREQARQRLVFSVPELRGRLLEQATAGVELLSGAVARRAGLPSDDFGAQVWAGAVVGVVLTSYFAAQGDGAGFLDALDRGLTLLEAGLPL
jgi:AcrR family transcriptional regulator